MGEKRERRYLHPDIIFLWLANSGWCFLVKLASKVRKKLRRAFFLPEIVLRKIPLQETVVMLPAFYERRFTRFKTFYAFHEMSYLIVLLTQ